MEVGIGSLLSRDDTNCTNSSVSCVVEVGIGSLLSSDDTNVFGSLLSSDDTNVFNSSKRSLDTGLRDKFDASLTSFTRRSKQHLASLSSSLLTRSRSTSKNLTNFLTSYNLTYAKRISRASDLSRARSIRFFFLAVRTEASTSPGRRRPTLSSKCV